MKEIKEMKYYCKLIVSNWDEWEQHAKKVLENRGSKTDEEVLAEIVKFDYKFDLIPDEPQSSLTESQNP